MNRQGHNSVEFFTGTEVERTPAHGKKTLFVVGVQSVDEIQRRVNSSKVSHIYFGANHSFPAIHTNDILNWTLWRDMITPFLDKGHPCTLEIDAACIEGLLESGLPEAHNFIPMISVKLPYIQQLGYNAIIKLDDKDFAATNPGVWCHSIHVLQDKNNFTSWTDYTKDKVLK